MKLSKHLKIAILIRHYNPSGGGAERYAVELTKHLAKQFEVHLFSQTIEKDENNNSSDITFHTVPQYLKRPRYLNQLLFSWSTRRATEGKFDIVHSHDMVIHANVYTLHVPCVKTRWSEAYGWRKWLRWLNTIISPRKLAYLWLEKVQITPKAGKQLIAVSEYLTRNIVMNYPKTKGTITIAYPGIHPNNNPYIKLRTADQPFRLLAVANDFKRKGVQRVIDAMEQLNQPDIQLTIAGSGNPNSLRIPSSLQKNIQFLGSVKSLNEIYQAADCLIHPTLVDTYGMVALEAMSYHLPVIVSNKNYCGFSEHLSESNALLLTDPRDSKEIAEKINLLYTDREFSSKIASNGFDKSQAINWDKTLRQTLNAYKRITSN